MLTQVRTFGVSNTDVYWRRRQQRSKTGERPIHCLLASLVEEVTSPGSRVLDCGAGEGHILQILGRDREVYANELSTETTAKYDFPIQGVDNSDLNGGLPDFGVEFDCVVASWLLHWLDRPQEFLNQVRDVLTPKGCVVLNVPNIVYYGYRLQLLRGQFPHVSLSHKNFQTPREIETMIRDSVFQIRKRRSTTDRLLANRWPKFFSRDIVYVLSR